MKKLIKTKFFQDNFIILAGTLAGSFLNYLFHFIIAHRISVTAYGELQSLNSSSIIFGVFNTAISYFIIRHTSVFADHNDMQANQEFTRFVLPKIRNIAIISIIFFFIISPFLASQLHYSSFLGFIIISIATFFSVISVIYQEVLRGWRHFFLLTLIGIVATFARFVSGIGLALIWPSATIIAISFMISSGAGWYMARYYYKKTIIPADSHKIRTEWKDKYFPEASIRKTAIKILAFTAILILISNLDVILVKFFSSAENAGYFGALAVIGKVVLWLNLAVAGVILPNACADGYKGSRPDRKKLLISYGIIVLIGAGLIFLYYLIPKIFIIMFIGNKYLVYSQLLWLFGVMAFLLSLLTLEANLSFAKQDYSVIYFLAATLLIMIAGISRYHANLLQIVLSFIISYLFGYLSVASLNLFQERKKLKAWNYDQI